MRIATLVNIALRRGTKDKRGEVVIRLINKRDEIIAHVTVEEGESPSWRSPAHDNLWAIYELVPRHDSASEWAYYALDTGLEAATNLLSAALAAGELRGVVKVGEEWQPLNGDRAAMLYAVRYNRSGVLTILRYAHRAAKVGQEFRPADLRRIFPFAGIDGFPVECFIKRWQARGLVQQEPNQNEE